jgi:hypothetical protein
MQATKSDYDTMKLADLKLLAKKHDIKRYSTMKKGELVSLLKTHLGKNIDGDEFTIHFKKSPFKILNQLIENKKLIVLQKCRDKNGEWILYHPDTLIVFVNVDVKKSDHYIAVGYLNESITLPLTKDHVYLCKEWNFDYALPENLTTNDIDSFQNIELEEIVNKVNGDEEDDDEDEYLPNYEEIL